MEVNLTKNEISEVSEGNIGMYDQGEYVGSAGFFHNISVGKDNYIVCYNDDALVDVFVTTSKVKEKCESMEYGFEIEGSKDIELYIDGICINTQNNKNGKLPKYKYKEEEELKYIRDFGGSIYDIPF